MYQEEGPNAVKSEILSKGYKFSQYSIKNFVGTPPPRRWLVDQSLELSKISLLCSIGGIGKSGITLKACLDINQGHGNFLGNKIMDKGNCIILSSEDDTDEVRRRIALLDRDNRRFETEYDTFVMCTSEMGKPLTLIKQDAINGLHITPEAIDEIADKHIPGFGEIFRFISLGTVGTSSIQSRACAVLAKGKYIFALPGSSGGVTDAWDKILLKQLDINHKPCNFVELFPRLKEK